MPDMLTTLKTIWTVARILWKYRKFIKDFANIAIVLNDPNSGRMDAALVPGRARDRVKMTRLAAPPDDLWNKQKGSSTI